MESGSHNRIGRLVVGNVHDGLVHKSVRRYGRDQSPLEPVAAIRVLNLLTIASVIFDILAAILLISLVSEISSNQEKKRKRVNERVRAASS